MDTRLAPARLPRRGPRPAGTAARHSEREAGASAGDDGSDDDRAPMDLGRLLLRITVGGTFFVHGTQKLFGRFGGYGPDGTGQFLRVARSAPGAAQRHRRRCDRDRLWPDARDRPRDARRRRRTDSGHDHGAADRHLEGRHQARDRRVRDAPAIAALSLAASGPGAPSLDRAFGFEHSGTGWMLAALGAGAAGSTMAIGAGRQEPASAETPASAPGEPARPE